MDEKRWQAVEFSYTITEQGARVDQVREAESLVAIPEEIEGRPVTELGAYALSGSSVEKIYLPSGLRRIGAYAFYNCERLREIICYSRVTDLGAGLFAGVRGVERLDMTLIPGEKSCLKDMLSELRQTLRVRLREDREDREDQNAGQTDTSRTVEQIERQQVEARLIFPEYFEESVENTPARILFIETHGCGHRYRYCFVNTQFQYKDYDRLFLHVQVQEPEELVTELALGRLQYPLGLTEEHRQMYRGYVQEHWKTAGKLLIGADRWDGRTVTNLEPGGLPWLVKNVLQSGELEKKKTGEESGEAGEQEKASILEEAGRFSGIPGLNEVSRVRNELGPNEAARSVGSGNAPALEEKLRELTRIAQQAGDTEMVSWLMDYGHETKAGTPEPKRERKRRFEL